jgi:protein O-mannosyl-transferase
MSKSKKTQKIESRQTPMQDILKQTKGVWSHHRLKLFIGVALIAVTLTIFWPVQDLEFVDFDDDVYVTHNTHVHLGLTWESFIWSFATTSSSEWHPLTWLSHMADYELYGLNPKGHHFTNLLFHTANVLILFLVLSRMSKNIWVSGLIAMLFAAHPLRVESVTWVAERKDVMSAFFWILSLWAYISYVEGGGIKRYLTVVFFFILGLMAKPMIVTLPFILLLLDYWPLGRFQLRSFLSLANSQPKQLRDLKGSNSTVPHLLLEKIPFFILSVLFSFLTLFAAGSGGAVKSIQFYPITMRVSNALVSYVSYIGKAIWPHPLACLYPYRDNIPLWQVAGAGLLLLGISIFAIRSVRKHPYFLVGWLWYLITLVPVIGLVQAGDQAMADRFTYVPLVGLFIIISTGAFVLSGGWRYRKAIILIAAGVLFLIYGAVTRFQIQHWRNSMTLFEHAIEVTSNNYIAQNNLGAVLAEQGKYDEAISRYREALRIRADYADAHYNLGNALSKVGKVQEAIEHHKAALRITPHDVKIRSKLGILLAGQRNYLEAIAHFEEALRIDPEYADAYNNIGVALLDQGYPEEAITHFREALRIKPNFQEAHFSICMAYLMTGRQDLALEEYKTLKTINPNLANILHRKMSNQWTELNIRK